MVAVQPVQNNAKIDIVALSGAYYLLSDMKKGRNWGKNNSGKSTFILSLQNSLQ